MAKSKKSKILAMALCASVMTGIYAAPVMAADAIYSDGKASVETTSDGTINFAVYTTQSDGTKNVARIASFDADGFSIHNGSGRFPVFYIGRHNGDFMAAGGDFAVDAGGNVTANGTLRVAGGDFTVDGDGNVVSLGNVTSTDGNITYNLNTVGANTAGITRDNVTKNITKTNIENSSITSAGELYINKANGQTNFSVDKYGNANVRKTLIAKEISVNNDRFTVDKNGTVHSDGTVYSERDFITTDKAGNQKYSLNAVGADLEELSGDFTTTNKNVAGIERDPVAETTTIEGDFAVNGKDNTFGSKNGSFTVNAEDGTFTAANGAFKVREGVGETVIAGSIISSKDILGNYGSLNGSQLTLRAINGESTLIDAGRVSIDNGSSSTIISGGDITAETLNGKVIDDLVEGSDIADDLANIGGIERSEGAGDPGTGTTTIENNLKVSGDKINMFGDTGLTFDKGTMNGVNVTNVSGNIGFNGSNVHFSYGSDGKTNTLGGLALTVDQIATDVSAIKEKTDHITVDDKGNVTISADDGSSLTVGKDGTSTGQGGQVTTDGNHTVNGDLDVDGSGQIDKDLTVGGDLEVGGSITTGNTTIDGSGMTVGDGTTITDGKVSSTEGAFGNINSNTGTIGNATFGKDNTIFGTGDNQTTINNDGVTVGGEEGTSIKNDSISVGDGGYIGDGDVRSGEGVSLNQTAERVGNLENRVGELEDRIDKVGAMAAAIANLRTMGYDPAAPTEVAVGIGQYRDETGAALGLFHYPNRDFMLSLSVSTSGDEVMGGIGATWKFGRKSPEKVAEIKKAQAEADARRAEEAKLAKAEEMKQAAKEAKIKAQQERHAKLAAERAAQAEAAK